MILQSTRAIHIWGELPEEAQPFLEDHLRKNLVPWKTDVVVTTCSGLDLEKHLVAGGVAPNLIENSFELLLKILSQQSKLHSTVRSVGNIIRNSLLGKENLVFAILPENIRLKSVLASFLPLHFPYKISGSSFLGQTHFPNVIILSNNFADPWDFILQLFHEMSHHQDIYLLRRWMEKNRQLHKPDYLFSCYVSNPKKLPTLNKSFYQIFCEGQAYHVEANLLQSESYHPNWDRRLREVALRVITESDPGTSTLAKTLQITEENLFESVQWLHDEIRYPYLGS